MPPKTSKTTKPTARKPTTARTIARKTTTVRGPARKAPPRRVAPGKPAPRADFGAPIDGFFARQPPELRAILTELRAIVEKEVPDATSSIKWGMPFFQRDGRMVVALGAHKAHVNLILAGPKDLFDDPDGLLTGDGKTGRRLVLRPGDEIPRAAVRRWIEAAAANAG